MDKCFKGLWRIILYGQSWISVLLYLFLLLIANFTAAQKSQIPKAFVQLDSYIPGVLIDCRYFSTNNFIGVQVDGYDKCASILSKSAAKALKKVQKSLKSKGLALKIFDAYRPQRAVDHFVEWAKAADDTLTKMQFYPEIDKSRLFELEYIAKRSGHTRGSTVDLTIIDIATQKELDMGSMFDFFGEISHHSYRHLTNEQKRNRKLLKTSMERRGFRSYSKEWWHYTLIDEPFPRTYFDFQVK